MDALKPYGIADSFLGPTGSWQLNQKCGAFPTGGSSANLPTSGNKLSNGITWFDHEIFQSIPWTHDITIKATAGSLAVVGAPSEVPVPAAVWLMGSALAGLGVIGRKKRPAIAA